MSCWILLRGLTREAAHWGDFPAELARTLPGARIVAIDLPGAGRLREQRCPLQVPAMIEPCRDQLADLGVAPPYHLLGLSLGGMVAAAWSRAHPQAVASCVLVNTSLRPYSGPGQRLRLARVPRLLALMAAGDERAMERAVLQLTSHRPDRQAAVLAHWLAIRRERPVSAANALRQLLAAARFRWSGAAPGVPVLVLRSALDALVDSGCSARIAAAWRAELRSHPEAGHDLPLDDGPWLAAQVADWERSLQRPPDRLR